MLSHARGFIMPMINLKPLRERLSAVILRHKKLKNYRAELLEASEALVFLDSKEERPVLPENFGDIPMDQADRIYAAAKAERDRRVLDRLPLGASRIGGIPDLPPGFAWPESEGRKIQFLAQIDFAQMPRWDDSPLPADGWLYYFGLYENDQDHVTAVHYFRGPRESLGRVSTPKLEEVWPTQNNDATYELLPLVPRLGLSVDHVRLADELDEDPKEFGDEVRAMIEASDIAEPKPDDLNETAWLLGDMAGVDGSIAEHVETLELDGDDWTNLLAITSSGTMEWGDSGTLYLLIRRSDLASGDFSRAAMTAGSG